VAQVGWEAPVVQGDPLEQEDLAVPAVLKGLVVQEEPVVREDPVGQEAFPCP
jgi:hypothetical protein